MEQVTEGLTLETIPDARTWVKVVDRDETMVRIGPIIQGEEYLNVVSDNMIGMRTPLVKILFLKLMIPIIFSDYHYNITF